MIENIWVVIKYSLSNENRLIVNLNNQNFVYYFPKIFVNKRNHIESLNLFPGYAFVKYDKNKLRALSYTKGLNYVLKTGAKYSFLENKYVEQIKSIQETSIVLPITHKPKINSDVLIKEGPLKGKFVKVVGYQANDRIKYMYSLLGRNLVSDTEVENIKY